MRWWVNQGLLPGRGRWEIAGSREQGAGSTHLDGQGSLADTTVAQDHQLVQGHFPRHGGQWRGASGVRRGKKEERGEVQRGATFRRGEEKGGRAAHKQNAAGATEQVRVQSSRTE